MLVWSSSCGCAISHLHGEWYDYFRQKLLTHCHTPILRVYVASQYFSIYIIYIIKKIKKKQIQSLQLVAFRGFDNRQFFSLHVNGIHNHDWHSTHSASSLSCDRICNGTQWSSNPNVIEMAIMFFKLRKLTSQTKNSSYNVFPCYRNQVFEFCPSSC
jgi:hypothetical protein